MTTSLPEPATPVSAQNESAPAQKKAPVAKRRAHVAPSQAKPARTATRAPKTATARRSSIPEEQTNHAPARATKEARVAKRRAHAAPSKAQPARQATRPKKAATARRGSKTAKILDLLKRPGGVTLKELVKATGWQSHSVRGFLSGTVGKKMETPVESSQRGDCERAYRISSK